MVGENKTNLTAKNLIAAAKLNFALSSTGIFKMDYKKNSRV